MISCAIRLALSIGIEKPTPMLPDWLDEDDEDPAEAMATLTPMISPWVLVSAPPELPGLMDASVWMTLRFTWPWSALLEPLDPSGGAKLKPFPPLPWPLL